MDFLLVQLHFTIRRLKLKKSAKPWTKDQFSLLPLLNRQRTKFQSRDFRCFSLRSSQKYVQKATTVCAL